MNGDEVLNKLLTLTLSPWSFFVATIIGLYGARVHLKTIFSEEHPVLLRSAENLLRASDISVLPAALPRVRVPDDREPIPLLTGAPLWTSLDNLERYTKKERPDFLFGLHLPGRLLSCYVAEQLNIPLEQCLYIATSPGGPGAFEIDNKGKFISGTAMVIDDISRTGRTFNMLRTFFEKSNARGETGMTRLLLATLVRGSIDDSSLDLIELNYVGYRWNTTRCNFPWTMRMTAIRHAWESKEKGQYNEYLMEMYKKIRFNEKDALDVFYEDVGRRPVGLQPGTL